MKILKYAAIQMVRIVPIPLIIFFSLGALGGLQALAFGRGNSDTVLMVIFSGAIVIVWWILYQWLKPLAMKYSPKFSRTTGNID